MNEQEWLKEAEHQKNMKRSDSAIRFIVESASALRDVTTARDPEMHARVLGHAFPELHIVERDLWQAREVELQCRHYLIDFSIAESEDFMMKTWILFANAVHQLNGIRDTLVAHMAGMAVSIGYKALQNEVRLELQAELRDKYETRSDDDESDD